MRILESALKGGISWNPGIEDFTDTALLASCEAARRDPNHAACQALKARIGVYKEPSGPVQAVGIPGLNPSPEMAIEDRGTPQQPQWNWGYSRPVEPVGIQMGGKKRGAGFQFRKEGAEYVIFDEETGEVIKRVKTLGETLQLVRKYTKEGVKVEVVEEPMEGEQEEVDEGAEVTAGADQQYRTQLKSLLAALAPRGVINHQTLFGNLQPFLEQSNPGHAFLIRLFPYLMKVQSDAPLHKLAEPMAKLMNDLVYYIKTPINRQKAYVEFMSGSGRRRGGGYWTNEYYAEAKLYTKDKELINRVGLLLKEKLKLAPSNYWNPFSNKKQNLVNNAIKLLDRLVKKKEKAEAEAKLREELKKMNDERNEYYNSEEESEQAPPPAPPSVKLPRLSGVGPLINGRGKKHGGAACKAPYHDYSKGKASVFALTCIDPRYTYDAAYFLQHKKELHQDYDLFTLAGSSVGVLKKEWTKTFFDNLELGLKLHGITEVWCFDHLDCGMYKATFGLDKDLDPKIHIDCMEKLKKLIKKKHPELKFRSFLIDSQGHISSV